MVLQETKSRLSVFLKWKKSSAKPLPNYFVPLSQFSPLERISSGVTSLNLCDQCNKTLKDLEIRKESLETEKSVPQGYKLHQQSENETQWEKKILYPYH